MKKIIVLCIGALLFFSCKQKSWEERCAEEAIEYTETHCPQDVGNGLFLDSLTYDASQNLNTYYYSASGISDNDSIFQAEQQNFKDDLLNQIAVSIELKAKKEHQTKLRYIYISKSTQKILLDCSFGPDRNGTYGLIR